MDVIEIRGLTKRFGNLTAVKDLDLTVHEGEVFGFLGPNGAGKSTTLKLLLNFFEPTAGNASIFGYDPWTETQKVRKRIGILPEGISLYNRLTAREHMEFASELRDCNANSQAQLERVGLADEADRQIGTYSKGMRQRLKLALALIGKPDLLVLDEPSSGFDPNGIQKMRDIIREERERGATILLSSHIMQEVKAVCDRIGIINNGEFVAMGTIDELREQTSLRESLVISVDEAPNYHEFESINGVKDVVKTGSQFRVTYSDASAKTRILSEIQETNTIITNIDIEKPLLEDIFAEYTIKQTKRETYS